MRASSRKSGGVLKARIADRFGAAAAHYAAASPLQRDVAEALAGRVKALPLPARPVVLEIGCGTGHLTEALRATRDGPDGGLWLASDIAPEMARATCREHPAVSGLVMDGERPCLAAGSVDLVVGSLVAQWFVDLPGALERLVRLLKPGGHLALATLGADSFGEWRAAHVAIGREAATPHWPDAGALRAMFPASMQLVVDEECRTDQFANPLDFLRGLRRIGADMPLAGQHPLTPGAMRRVLRHLATDSDASGAARVSYHVLYAVARQAQGPQHRPPASGTGPT